VLTHVCVNTFRVCDNTFKIVFTRCKSVLTHLSVDTRIVGC
jgi:hypothetical protein